MFCLIVDLARWYFELPSQVQRRKYFFIIRFWMGLSEWIWFILKTWDSGRVKPSFPGTSRPSRLTIWVLTTNISMFLASQFPDFKLSFIDMKFGISRLLRHLYRWEHLSGFIQLDFLQLRNILLASSLFRKLLGLLVSAIQYISGLFDVVRIHILSDSLGSILWVAGC